MDQRDKIGEWKRRNETRRKPRRERGRQERREGGKKEGKHGGGRGSQMSVPNESCSVSDRETLSFLSNVVVPMENLLHHLF